MHIAAEAGAQLHLIFISDITDGNGGSSSDADPALFYETVVKKILAERNLKTNVSFWEGMVGHVIVRYVSEHKISTVIMGVNGGSASGDSIIGPNAYYVIKRVACPVLLIPAEYRQMMFDKVLLPTRPKMFTKEIYSSIYDTIGKDVILSELKVLGIFTNKYEHDIIELSTKVFELRNKNAKDKSHLSFTFCRNPDVAEEVLNILYQNKTDLVVISPGIDSVSRPSFIGPFSQKIINNAVIPVLSLVGC